MSTTGGSGRWRRWVAMTVAVAAIGAVVVADMVANPPRRLGRIDIDGVPPTAGQIGPVDQAYPGAAVHLSTVLTSDALTAMATTVDGDLLVGTIDGRVHLVERRPQGGRVRPRTLPEPVLDLSAEVRVGGEQGLLGMATSPDGGHLYVSFTSEAEAGAIRVDELAIVDGTPDASARRRLLTVPNPTPFHNGGGLVVDGEGWLWIGLGDGGYEEDGTTYSANGQDRTSLLGKLLRIDPGGGGESPYLTADPPVVAGARPEIWSWGLRNPWRFTLDSETGDLWVADVGDATSEEVNHLPASRGVGRGANLGWDLREGDQPTLGVVLEPDRPMPPVVDPVLTYATGEDGCAIIGGAVYRGTWFPDLVGAYVYTDFCNSTVHTLRPDGDGGYEEGQLEGVQIPGQPTGIHEGPGGELYATTLAGLLLRFDPADEPS